MIARRGTDSKRHAIRRVGARANWSSHLKLVVPRIRVVFAIFIAVVHGPFLQLSLLPDVSFADTGGDFYGIIRDGSSRTIPGAIVTAIDSSGSVTRSDTTDADGQYRLPALPPNTYTLRAESNNLAPGIRREQRLVLGQYLQVDFDLQPAGHHEGITVVANN